MFFFDQVDDGKMRHNTGATLLIATSPLTIKLSQVLRT
jgi:hypothetical protein